MLLRSRAPTPPSVPPVCAPPALGARSRSWSRPSPRCLWTATPFSCRWYSWPSLVGASTAASAPGQGRRAAPAGGPHVCSTWGRPLVPPMSRRWAALLIQSPTCQIRQIHPSRVTEILLAAACLCMVRLSQCWQCCCGSLQQQRVESHSRGTLTFFTATSSYRTMTTM